MHHIMILATLVITLLVIAFGLLVLYISAILIIHIAAFVVALFKFLTGKLTREQLAESAALHEAEKAERKRREKYSRQFSGSIIIDIQEGKC